jgi:thiol:disulfide interchange protein DsbC
MNKRFLKVWMMASVFLGIGYAAAVTAGEAEDIATVKQVLSSLMPQAQPESITASALPGMYEAVYGPQIIYVSKDGRYMFEGDLYDLRTRVNLTEDRRRDGRSRVMAKIDPKTMIVFAPEKTKHVITAFTDIDCGYCRKLHKQIAEYNDLGIEIRYLAYPRAGLNTPSYDKAVSVWCAADQREALTRAKAGEKLPKADCDNPVKSHMAAAREVGVTGTPTLVLESGRVIPGYVEPKRLIQILDQLKSS